MIGYDGPMPWGYGAWTPILIGLIVLGAVIKVARGGGPPQCDCGCEREKCQH